MIHGIDHTALSVPSLEKALDFYGNLFGFEVLFNAGWPQGSQPLDDLVGLENSESKVAMIQLGDTKIEVFEYQSPEPEAQDANRPVNDHGITHICLRVSGLQQEYERLRDAGVIFNSEPVDLGTSLCVYGRDPFGNTFELIEDIEPAA